MSIANNLTKVPSDNQTTQPNFLSHNVACSFLDQTAIPLVVQPTENEIDLSIWLTTHKEEVRRQLYRCGAILFRDFGISDTMQFQQCVESYSAQQMLYFDKTSPRSALSDKLYTSTDHPADQIINMHNELSYSANWPMTIFFYCEVPAKTGGETPIADSRRVLRLLGDETREAFLEKGVEYVRNMMDGIGLPWQDVYQTDDKDEVKSYCQANGIHFEWLSDRQLRTRWIKEAVHKHPATHELTWFNHGYFYHERRYDPIMREVFKKEDLPFATYFGDGSDISQEVVEELVEAYRRSTVSFPWHRGDILLLDNMLTAHGRNRFTGERKIVVAMCDPHY